MKRLGQKIASLRKNKNWTQGQLALYAQIERSYISKIEAGGAPNVSGIIVARIARALGTTADYLLGLTDDPHPCPSPEALGATERVAGDPLFQEVVKVWLDLDAFGREFVRNAARLGSRRPALRLVAEQSPQYARDLDGAIAELVALYSDLGPLFDEAKQELPEHAIWALIYNVRIWIERKEETKEFASVHRRLSDFLVGGKAAISRGE